MRKQLNQYKGSCANCKHPTNHPIPKMTQEQPSEHRAAAQNIRKGEMKSSSCVNGTHNLTLRLQPQQFSEMTDRHPERKPQSPRRRPIMKRMDSSSNEKACSAQNEKARKCTATSQRRKKKGKYNRAFKFILNDSLESVPKTGLSSQNILFDKGCTTIL